MQLLKRGVSGPTVEIWQNFLRGLGQVITADGNFGAETVTQTQRFQRQYKLTPDGAVGSRTWGKALSLGLGGLLDVDEDGADWPPKPQTLIPYRTDAERVAAFGAFTYEPAPTASNPEGIRVTDDWTVKHIKPLRFNRQAGSQGQVTLRTHTAAIDAFRDTVEHWRREKLLKLVTEWNGSYVARFIRGSRTSLSNHAYGTAIDVNAPYNRLGQVPALKGTRGCVRELVEIANEHDLWWGGHFERRKDGMHFELARRL